LLRGIVVEVSLETGLETPFGFRVASEEVDRSSSARREKFGFSRTT
jgi:hypothetical protein